MASTATLHDVLTKFPSEMQTPIWHLVEWMEEKWVIPHEDFEGLKQIVSRLAAAQERTEQHVDKLESAVERLAAAQERTEQRVDKLEGTVERLAVAQERTEQLMQELALAQKNTEVALQRLEKSMADRFAELGSRWGIYTEGTFRTTIRGILEHTDDMTVTEGYYGGRQVDIIIRNGEHILLEITSRVHTKDLDKLYKSADDYRDKEGIEPKLMIATSSVSPKIMQKIMESTPQIELFTYDEE